MFLVFAHVRKHWRVKWGNQLLIFGQDTRRGQVAYCSAARVDQEGFTIKHVSDYKSRGKFKSDSWCTDVDNKTF